MHVENPTRRGAVLRNGTLISSGPLSNGAVRYCSHRFSFRLM
jgi:hypothetical protein